MRYDESFSKERRSSEGPSAQTPRPLAARNTGDTTAMAPSAQRATPDGWLLQSVERMGDVATGKALAVNAPGRRRPYLRTKNVFDGRVDIDDVLTMPMTDAEFERFLVVPGDVLLNEGQSLELVGRCAMYRGEHAKPCAMQNQLLRFRARPGVSTDFAAHLFRYSQQQGVFARIALQTTSIAHLGATRLEKLELLWPEREAEQRAIAAALSDVDELIGALEALIAKKRAIKQSAIQDLLTGRTRLPGFSGEWSVAHLENHVIRFLSHGTSSRSELTEEGPVKYLHYGDIHSASAVYVGADFKSLPAIPAKRARGLDRLEVGDLVMVDASEDLEGVGKSVEVKVPPGQQLVAGLHTIAVRFDKSVLADGFKAYLQFCPAFGTHLRRLAAGTKVYATNRAHVASAEVRLPDPNEQRAIAKILSGMDDEIVALERRLDKTRSIKQGAMQQLLTGSIRLPIADDGASADGAGGAPGTCRAGRRRTGAEEEPAIRETGP